MKESERRKGWGRRLKKADFFQEKENQEINNNGGERERERER